MPVGAWLNVKKAVDWGSSMSLTKREGVNLEKVERRLKIDVKRDANSLFLPPPGAICTGSRLLCNLWKSEMPN